MLSTKNVVLSLHAIYNKISSAYSNRIADFKISHLHTLSFYKLMLPLGNHRKHYFFCLNHACVPTKAGI